MGSPLPESLSYRLREQREQRIKGVWTMTRLDNAFFIVGTAYAGKSTMIKALAEKYQGILCEENYHDRFFPDPDREEFPCLCYTRDLEDWQY
jgi:hypothetical protein